jgi:hypothetical protein
MVCSLMYNGMGNFSICFIFQCPCVCVCVCVCVRARVREREREREIWGGEGTVCVSLQNFSFLAIFVNLEGILRW